MNGEIYINIHMWQISTKCVHKGTILASTIDRTPLRSQQSTNVFPRTGFVREHFCSLTDQLYFVVWLISSALGRYSQILSGCFSPLFLFFLLLSIGQQSSQLSGGSIRGWRKVWPQKVCSIWWISDGYFSPVSLVFFPLIYQQAKFSAIGSLFTGPKIWSVFWCLRCVQR